MEDAAAAGGQRHPAVAHMLSMFDTGHLPADVQNVCQHFRFMAHFMVDTIPDKPELTAGLRKLLEAMDCAVRAMKID